MNSPKPRIPPSLAPRDEPIEVLLADEPAFAPPPRPGVFRRVVFWTLVVLALLFFAPPAVVLALRWADPPTSAFMLQSEVQPVEYHWVPASQIPETMRVAVVAAEDQKFWTHWGFDFIAIAEALEHNEKSKKKRGASTITQQTAKNLFLWPSRSWLRKGLEVTFTLLLELAWSKDRILEVYLNIAEFGPGVYGVEAASQKFFGRPAAEMTPEQTARLTAVLPNPRKWSASRPGPYVQRRIDWILVHTGHPPRFFELPATEGPGEVPAEVPEPPAGEQPPEEGAPVDEIPLEGAPAPGEAIEPEGTTAPGEAPPPAVESTPSSELPVEPAPVPEPEGQTQPGAEPAPEPSADPAPAQAP